MLTIAGRRYAKNNAEMVDSLFHAGGTCSGQYRTRKGGILLLNLQGKPFAFIANGRKQRESSGLCWFVTASSYDGRTFYMQGLAEYTERELGIESLSYSAQHDLASATIKALEDYEPPQSLAQRTMVITADDPDFA